MDETKQIDTPAKQRADFLTSVPLEIMVSVGRARTRLADLLALENGAVLPLDRQIDDPVELYLGDRLIARGTLQELDGEQAGQIAVCLTDVTELGEP